MKLKGLTKLALSGVALAAVAATLGTSTYAWYVSNSKAEINSISGQSNTQAAGSLLINQLAESDTGNNVISNAATWTNKVVYSSLQWTQAPLLEPVTRDTTATETGFHDVSGASVAKNKAYGYFLIGIKTTDAAKRTINMKLGIANNSENAKTQTAYVGSDKGAPTNVLAGGSFTEDFIYALKFDYHVEALTGTKKVSEYITNGVTTTGDDPTYTRHTAYNAESFQNSTFSGYYKNITNGTTLSGAKTDGDAHAYYKALSVDNTTTSNNTTSIIGGEDAGTSDFGESKSFVLPDATNEYVIVMRYWLDGADAQCFDSCISQSFVLSINLEATASPQA